MRSAYSLGDRQVVHCRQYGEAPLATQPVDQVEHLLLVADVEGAGRLVEEQGPCALRERPGEEDALPLAAGERVEPPGPHVDQVERDQRLVDRGEIGGGLPAQRRHVRGAAEQHVVEDQHPGRHDGRLRDGGDRAGPLPARQPIEGGAAEADVAVERQQAADGPQRGGLA
nr:hypothetical protein GCM10020092_105610 [Actinoplanes digitatis]